MLYLTSKKNENQQEIYPNKTATNAQQNFVCCDRTATSLLFVVLLLYL